MMPGWNDTRCSMSVKRASVRSSLRSMVVVSLMLAAPSLPQRGRIADEGIAAHDAPVEFQRIRIHGRIEECVDVEQRRQTEDEAPIGDDDLVTQVRRQFGPQHPVDRGTQRPRGW